MKSSGVNTIIFYIFFFYSFLIVGEGFVAGTLVKVPAGYEAIENLLVGDLVICFDTEKHLVERPIVSIIKKSIPRYVRLLVDGEAICLASEQQVYSTENISRIASGDLRPGDMILTGSGDECILEVIESKNISKDVYLLSIEEHHNFFVSTNDVCVHNFIPPFVVGIFFLFGGGAIEWAGVSFGIASLGSYFGYQWHKKSQHNVEIIPLVGSSGMMPDDPDDEDDKKISRNKLRENYRSLTNKDARKLAKDMGYTEIKSHPCGDTRNKPVFTNGKNYISADADGHNGGVWKLFNRSGRRIGTADINLKLIGG